MSTKDRGLPVISCFCEKLHPCPCISLLLHYMGCVKTIGPIQASVTVCFTLPVQVFSNVDWNQDWVYGNETNNLTKCMSGKGSTFLHAEGLSCNLFSHIPLVVLLKAKCIAGEGGERIGEVRGEEWRGRRSEGRRGEETHKARIKGYKSMSSVQCGRRRANMSLMRTNSPSWI